MCTYMYVYQYLIKIYFFLRHSIFLNKRPNQFKYVSGIQMSLIIVYFHTYAHLGTCDKCDFMKMAGHGAINTFATETMRRLVVI